MRMGSSSVIKYLVSGRLPSANFVVENDNREDVLVYYHNEECGVPAHVSFFDKSKGNPTNWKWDFGDGNVSTIQNPEHFYYEFGNYSITLTVSNTIGETHITKSVLIAGCPLGMFNMAIEKAKSEKAKNEGFEYIPTFSGVESLIRMIGFSINNIPYVIVIILIAGIGVFIFYRRRTH